MELCEQAAEVDRMLREKLERLDNPTKIQNSTTDQREGQALSGFTVRFDS